MKFQNNRCPALLWIALALAIATQAQPQYCIGGAVNPIVRAEGYTELAGDLIISCFRGDITPVGSAVPAVTISVQMNTTITSKIISSAFTPNYNEALLLIDEPGRTYPNDVPNPKPILNCGSANAPFDTNAAEGVCTIRADGTPTYGGTPHHPNVFQGRQVLGSSNQTIQFMGVPLDGGAHTLRITNLRGNVAGHAVINAYGEFPALLTIVTFKPQNTLIEEINTQNGRIQYGLASVTGATAGTYSQCGFPSAKTVSAGSVTLSEGFPSAWKVRNWRQIQDNGSFVGTIDWHFNGTHFYNANDMVQNVANAFYGTESGFIYPPSNIADLPPVNPPPGISLDLPPTPSGNTPFGSGTGDPTGISTAGTVSNGTRFSIKFANIPAGVTISVPGQVDLVSASGGTTVPTGTMVAVGGADANGAGGTVGAGIVNGLVTGSGNFTVIYEVIFADPLTIESATVNITANVRAFDGTNPQVNKTATVQAGFAPSYDNLTTPAASTPLLLGSPLNSSTGPIPRFITAFMPATPIELLSFASCTQPTFQPPDTGTQGNWKGVYGTDGYIIANDSSKIPAYLTPPAGGLLTGASPYTWVASSTDGRALQKAASATDRIASTFYAADSFTIDLPFKDGLTHQVAMYLLDLDTSDRSETITLVDPTSNAVLSTQSFSNFHNGTWAVLNVQQPARIRVSRTGGLNAVMSGIFFKTLSSVPKPTVLLTVPYSNQQVSGTVLLSASTTVNSPGDIVVSVQFQLDGNNLGAPVTSGPPYTFSWNTATTADGPHSLVAVATDSFSQTTSSVPVSFGVNNPFKTSAEFVKTDTTTQGTWKGRYGSEGEIVALDSTSAPANAAVSFFGAQTFQWTVTGDPRALQEANSATLRVASAYYGSPGFSMYVDFQDLNIHQIALYFMDWDGGGRGETVTVLDTFTREVLDGPRQVSNFTGGQYLVWNVKRHVIFQVDKTSGANALLNGVFLGPPPP